MPSKIEYYDGDHEPDAPSTHNLAIPGSIADITRRIWDLRGEIHVRENQIQELLLELHDLKRPHVPALDISNTWGGGSAEPSLWVGRKAPVFPYSRPGYDPCR